MSVTITLPESLEDQLKATAQREGVPVEELVARRLLESELLWSIRIAAPENETREFHRLLKKQKNGTLTTPEHERLFAMIDARERQAARRMHDLGVLAHLRGLSIRDLMNQLGIRPIPAP